MKRQNHWGVSVQWEKQHLSKNKRRLSMWGSGKLAILCHFPTLRARGELGSGHATSGRGASTCQSHPPATSTVGSSIYVLVVMLSVNWTRSCGLVTLWANHSQEIPQSYIHSSLRIYRQNASLKGTLGWLRAVFIRSCIQDPEFQCVFSPNFRSKASKLCRKRFDTQILALYPT